MSPPGRGVWFLQEAGLWIILAASIVGFVYVQFSRGSSLPGLTVAIGALLLGANLLAWAHGKRFRSGGRECLVTGFLFGAIVCLPILPLFFRTRLERSEFGQMLYVFTAFLSSALLGVLLIRMDRATGRYFHGERELPELEGPAREIADSTLAALGHPALSVRAASFGSFNALVQGVRHCIVVVDRGAAESLSPSHFASLLAHEAGHLKLGGTYSYVLVISVWAAVVTGIGPVAEMSPIWSPVVLVGCWICSQNLLSQLGEVFCDRLASKHTGAESTAGMLRRIHDDLPHCARGGLLQGLAASHPPLRIRLAALGCAPRGDLLPYAILWSSVLLICLVLPLGVLVAWAAGVPSSPALVAVSGIPLLYFFFVCSVAALKARGMRRAGGDKLEPRRRGRWIRWSLSLSTATLVGLTLFIDLGDIQPTVLLVAFGAFVVSALLGIFTGAFRSASEQIPRRILKTLADASGAFEEGRGMEGLAIIDEGLARYPTSRHLALLRGGMLLNLGRLDEAVSLLEALRDREKDYGMADLNLATAELLRGNLDRAEALLEAVLARSSEFGSALYFAALAAYEKGALDSAEEKLLRASRAKARDAQVLAGRALVSLDRGDLALARNLVQEALDLERPSGVTLLARALVKKEEGDDDGARSSFEAALERARERGMPGWIPYYERLAARKGLSPGPT